MGGDVHHLREQRVDRRAETVPVAGALGQERHEFGVRDVADGVRFHGAIVAGDAAVDNEPSRSVLGSGGDFFLTLFRGDRPGLNHYCYAIKDYDADRAEEKLKAAGLKPRREGNRVSFHDPDGIQVQVAGS
jgi:hypothetical protein